MFVGEMRVCLRGGRDSVYADEPVEWLQEPDVVGYRNWLPEEQLQIDLSEER